MFELQTSSLNKANLLEVFNGQELFSLAKTKDFIIARTNAGKYFLNGDLTDNVVNFSTAEVKTFGQTNGEFLVDLVQLILPNLGFDFHRRVVEFNFKQEPAFVSSIQIPLQVVGCDQDAFKPFQLTEKDMFWIAFSVWPTLELLYV